MARSNPAHGYNARLFGQFRLASPDERDVTPKGRKARALLSYCLLTADQPSARDRLTGLLWGDRGDEQARASLRQAVYELRDLTGGTDPLIVAGRESLAIQSAQIFTDLDQMREAVALGDGVALAALVGERPAPLLLDLDHIDAGFDDWLAGERAFRERQRRGLMLEGARHALAAEKVDVVNELAAVLHFLDPLDGDAVKLAIAAARAGGDRVRARDVFERHAKATHEELGVEPSADVIRAYRDLRAATPVLAPESVSPTEPVAPGAPPPTQLPGPKPNRRILAAAILASAVLGFGLADWSRRRAPAATSRTLLVEPLTAPANDASARALRTGLSANLSKLIVGVDATLDVVDPDDASPQVNQAATYRIVGEATSSGGRLHATIRLLYGTEAAMLWSSSFSQPADQVDALRQRIAIKVGDVTTCALGGTNPATEALGLATTRLYLAGCEQRHGDWRLSAMLLKQVVRQQPLFAHAWAMLGAAMSVSARTADDSMLASRYARHALSLDPRDGEAWFAVATADCDLHACAGANALIDKGLAVEPSNAQLLAAKTNRLMDAGRIDDAIDVAQRGVNLDPFASLKPARLAGLLAIRGEREASQELLDREDKLWPENKYLNEVRLWNELWFGDPQRALVMLDDPRFALQIAYVTRVDPDAKETWRKVLRARLDPSARPAANAALLASARAAGDDDLELMVGEYRIGLVVAAIAIGNRDTAYTIAERLRSKDPAPLYAKSMADFRADPRFMREAARMGLIDRWRWQGRWPDFCRARDAPFDCSIEAARVTRR